VAKSSKLDTLTSELENRLDELFQEEGALLESIQPAGSSSQPLAELKKIVLSIDWEITPQAVESFLAQIRLLKEVYQNDKVVTMFLQVLGSLGQYIKSNRSKAHPATFSLLNSAFARLEEITSVPGMPEVTKRKMLQVEMAAYQQLREKISKRRAAGDGKPSSPAQPVAAPAAPPAGGVVTAQMLEQAMAELKEFIRSEMAALRRQLKTGATRSERAS
jgi:hypothetical protein